MTGWSELRTAADQRTLIASARAGDRDSFCQLVGPHLDVLRARARGAARERSDVDADEIVQQTLVRAFQAIDLFNDRYDFGQYLFGIARYVILRHVNARAREITIAWDSEPDGMELPGPLPADKRVAAAARAIAGVDRFPPPDETLLARIRLRALLEVVLTYGGYPHQQIAFAYGTILWGRRKREPTHAGASDAASAGRGPITSDPDQVVRTLSDIPLAQAARGFREEIEAIEGFGKQDLDGAFRALDFRLSLSPRALFERDRASQSEFARIAGHEVGRTVLRDYYGKSPQRSVTGWIKAVKTRARRCLQGETDFTRCPFPMPDTSPTPRRQG